MSSRLTVPGMKTAAFDAELTCSVRQRLKTFIATGFVERQQIEMQKPLSMSAISHRI